MKRLSASGLVPELITEVYLDRIFVAALKICRSIEYCIQSASGRSEQIHVLFPMRMAWHALVDVEPALALWLQRMLYKFQCVVPGHEGITGYVLKVGYTADLGMAP